jgi:hypothetical protein
MTKILLVTNHFVSTQLISFRFVINDKQHIPIDVANRSFSRPPPPLRCLAKSSNSAHAHWVVDFENFAKQRNRGGGGREKDLYISFDVSFC